MIGQTKALNDKWTKPYWDTPEPSFYHELILCPSCKSSSVPVSLWAHRPNEQADRPQVQKKTSATVTLPHFLWLFPPSSLCFLEEFRLDMDRSANESRLRGQVVPALNNTMHTAHMPLLFNKENSRTISCWCLFNHLVHCWYNPRPLPSHLSLVASGWASTARFPLYCTLEHDSLKSH